MNGCLKICGKTSVDGCKIVKFMNLESFPLYGTLIMCRIATDVFSIKFSVQLPGSPHCSSSTIEASYVMTAGVAVNSGT